MATQSRARMFYGTAKALNSVAAQRLADPMHALLEQGDSLSSGSGFGPEGDDALLLDDELSDVLSAQLGDAAAVDREALRALHAEFRWAESRLMQASERVAEAQEARRKDLVALACMRRDLRASFIAERAYVLAQIGIFDLVLERVMERENELSRVLELGAVTEPLVRDLAAVRAERKLHELAIGQARAQIARISDNEGTLEHEVASEAYDVDPDGKSMRELARLRSEQTRAHRAALRARGDVRRLLEGLDMDTSHGEIAAAAAFLASEFEGESRAQIRMETVRAAQIEHELRALPEPTSSLKAGLRHPVGWLRAKRTTN